MISVILLNFRIVVFSSDDSIFTSSIEWTNFALYTIKIQLEMVEIWPKHYSIASHSIIIGPYGTILDNTGPNETT